MPDINKIFNLHITGENFNFEQEINPEQQLKIISFLLLPVQMDTEQVKYLPASQQQTVKTSPLEYLSSKKAITNPQKIAVFLLYARETELKESLGSVEIKVLFERSRQPMPKNFKRDLDKAITSKWIDASSNPDKFRLTATGEEAIKNGFNMENRKNKGSGTRAKGGKKIKFLIREAIKNIQPEPSVKYWKMSKSDKILWLMQQAKSNNIEAIHAKEISALADKISDRIPESSIAALSEAHKKNSRVYISQSSEGHKLYKLSHDGEEYLNIKLGEVA